MVRKGKDKKLHLKQIQCYVSTGKHHESTEVSEQSGIRKACNNFEAKGIKLCFIIELSLNQTALQLKFKCLSPYQ